MTKITEQLECLSQDEIKFIHEIFDEAVKRSKAEIEKTKLYTGFLNAVKDVTSAYFPEGSPEDTKVFNGDGLDITNEDIKEKSKNYIADLEKANLQYTTILNKLTPLIEIIKTEE